MTTQIQQNMAILQDQIYAEKYFLPLYEKTLAKRKLTEMSFKAHEVSDKDIINFANDFWEALPDSPGIRTEPFFSLCTIASHSFDEEPEEV